jgi:hypothetical protein
MNYKKKIRQSELTFKIKDIAQKVFSVWLDNASFVYDFSPEYIDKIKGDEVENTFLDHLERAINSLVHDKSDEKTSIKGWSFGFLCGHIQGSIDLEWVNKYVIEPSEEYENLMKAKAIKEFINLDSASFEKIFLIYEHLISKRVQPLEETELSCSNIKSIFEHKNSNSIKFNKFKTDMNNFLFREFEFKYMKMLNSKNRTCCPDMTYYLDESIIVKIVGNKHFT